MGEAFATLITSDAFFPGVQVLVYSLRRVHSSRPIVVLVSGQVSDAIADRVARIADSVIRVGDIPSPTAAGSVPAGWINSGYTKLHLWRLTDYSKLVYIDADALVLENVDELFARPGLAAAPDVFPPDRFNAGVLVVEPSAHVFEQMMGMMHELPNYDGGDTGFLNAFFPDWYLLDAAHRLPFRFNALRTLHWLTASKNPGYWQQVQPKIVHYCSSPKPWETGDRKGDLEWMWWRVFMEAQGMPPELTHAMQATEAASAPPS